MSFEGDLRKFVSKTEARADRVIRKVIIMGFQGVTTETPVDTGRAKANWNIAIGSPDLSTSEAVDFGATQAAANAKIAGITSKDENIYLSNNLPYVMALEYGHSSQRPNGMVRVTATTLRNMIRAGKITGL